MRDRNGNEVLYMAVTADKYELPFAVFCSADEVAQWAGIKRQSVHCMIWYDRKGRKNTRGYKLVKVVIEDA